MDTVQKTLDERILVYPENEAELCTVCEPCIPGDGTGRMFEDLMDVVQKVASRALGLSLNQIGFLKRGFAMRYGSGFMPVMNPEIVRASANMRRSLEGCLSRPGIPPVEVRRHKNIKVRFTDPFTEEIRELKLTGRDSVVFQHELDHANGVLI